MRLGLRATPLAPRELLARRLFASQVTLPEPWQLYYRRLDHTPGIDHPARYTLTLAF